MNNLALIDKIISEVNGLDEKDKILLFQKLEEVSENLDTQQNKKIPIESAFGLWKNRNITKEILREKAWKKN